MGRIRRLMSDRLEASAFQAPPIELFCCLCARSLPKSEQEAHHLIPRSKGGRETVLLHRICHKKIHASLSETELAREYNSIERLLMHPEISAFVRWLANKPQHFYEKSRKTNRLKGL
jgi:hypothetical protein